jgi:hypothetical protein
MPVYEFKGVGLKASSLSKHAGMFEDIRREVKEGFGYCLVR